MIGREGNQHELRAILLKRDYTGTSKDNDDQGHGFTGIALQGISGAKLWSKAGWTSTTRHDAAYIELPGKAVNAARSAQMMDAPRRDRKASPRSPDKLARCRGNSR
jgi:hypothetical protein